MRVLAALLILAAATPAAAQTLEQAAIRNLLARQERLWNAGDLDGYFATFTPDARFDDRAVVGPGETVSYGTSSLAKARANAAKLISRARVTERSDVLRIYPHEGGRTAKVLARETTRIVTAEETRTICADSVHLVRLTPQGVRSAGQTDYIRRCPR